MVEWKDPLNDIGTFISSLTHKGLQFFQDTGIIVSPLTAKLFTILIVLGLTYIILNFFQSMKPLVRWGIIIVAGILIISVGMTFLPT